LIELVQVPGRGILENVIWEGILGILKAVKRLMKTKEVTPLLLFLYKEG